jgi:organic hydroperoxide reductase OsmC/OhrA
MTGTLARFLAERQIPTPENRYLAEAEGDIENVNNVLKITQIRVKFHLKVPQGKAQEAREAFSSYLTSCPAAQSVIGCIHIQDDLAVEEMAGSCWVAQKFPGHPIQPLKRKKGRLTSS